MKKSRFTEEQIIRILKEGEAGGKIEELCRRHSISKPTYYNWKSKYGGLEISELRRLKGLEAENSKLKRPSDVVLQIDSIEIPLTGILLFLMTKKATSSVQKKSM